VGVVASREQFLHCGLRKFRHSKSSVYRWYVQLDRRRFVYDTWDNRSRLGRVMVECSLSITHCLRLNLQLHTIDLVRTCRISSFCTVSWQLARFQLTRRIARSLGDSWACCFISLYLFCHQLTYRSDPSTDIHAWWLKRRSLTQGCAFFGHVDIVPHFRGETPQKKQFWGVNRHFQAKRAKYWKFHVIETTASILTKFGTTIETTKWSSRVVPAGAQQIQDGGRPPFWKNR